MRRRKMFTGIIRDIGSIIKSRVSQDALSLHIKTNLPLSRLSVGASVACNGCCLTVVSSEDIGTYRVFVVDVGPKTLEVTNFRKWSSNQNDYQINLEPSLLVGDSLCGHQMSGHIDTLLTCLSVEQKQDGFCFISFELPLAFSKYIIAKGSIALNGVSLTIAELTKISFQIMLIPQTLAETNLKYLKVGDQVEAEFDMQVKTIVSTLERMDHRYTIS